MAWNIRTNLEDVDIENASVLEIKRSPNELRVFLDFAKISYIDESSTHDTEIIKKPCLLFRDVSYENVVGENANPVRPLDLIEVVDYSTGKLTLSGYINNKPWYVWEVESKSLSVTWGKYIANAT